jgi:thiosulfate dehydrogenase
VTAAPRDLASPGAAGFHRVAVLGSALMAGALLVGSAGCGNRASQGRSAASALPDSVAEPRGYVVPAGSLIPKGPLGVSIRRGHAIMLATPDSLPGHVGNRLSCTNCHLDAGTRPSASPWVGTLASFPQYNARAGRVIRIEDRINECLRRSLNGSPLDPGGRDMTDMVAYFAFLSTGMPMGHRAAWLGYRMLAPGRGDPDTGARIFAERCARCHGPDGQGGPKYPPLWGPNSFAIGAGMARMRTAATFIRWNMPYDRRGTLSDAQAYDVAAFVLSHARPDTPGKERDWPNGDPPADAAYETLAHRALVARGR